MSGIIGGAGSKSGVIGTTELDYEAGEFTVSGSNVTSNGGRYIKIGNVVNVTFRFTAINGSSTSSPGGLPFTGIAQLNSEKPGGGSVIYQNDSTVAWNCLVNTGNTTFFLYAGSAMKQLTSGATAICVMTYISA